MAGCRWKARDEVNIGSRHWQGSRRLVTFSLWTWLTLLA